MSTNLQESAARMTARLIHGSLEPFTSSGSATIASVLDNPQKDCCKQDRDNKNVLLIA
jgi:hypothetical protein